ncbi:MAG: 4Fe-4S dicluster domain-containing protein [Anaerolineae bacterium]|nr:4Fe-4S dicluster domain-containing protein [Anaerolineae bacterium]
MSEHTKDEHAPQGEQIPQSEPAPSGGPTQQGPTRELDRREFVRLIAGLGISAAAAGWVWSAFLAHNDPAEEVNGHGEGPYWVMVIDLEACIGCERCVYACQATNDTDSEHRWNILLTDEETFGQPVFITRPCMHCEHAPCVEVCPVAATYHREDGLVMMDYQRCIGCRYCMVACPYGVRVFNWDDREDETDNEMVPTWGTPEINRRPRGVAEKCTFCSQRIDLAYETGLRPGYDRAVTPACVNICPTEARRFGDLNDPESPVSRAMKGRQAVVLRENLGTHPRVYYLLPEAEEGEEA